MIPSRDRLPDSFRHHAGRWWEADGPFAPLHRINPVRLRYIVQGIEDHRPAGKEELGACRILDIGCGGGLVSEPLARRGARVTGIDPSPEAIEAARKHARASRLAIDYRCAGISDSIEGGAPFDVVIALEVIEHTDDPQAFIAAAAAKLAPGGLLFLSTLNRSLRSWLTAIVGAEYLLGWIEKGTHDWNRFLTPAEIETALNRAGLDPIDISGIVYRPISRRWILHPDTGVNYILSARM